MLLSLLLYDPSVLVGFVLIAAVVWRWVVVPRDALRCEYVLLIAVFTLIAAPVAQAIADWLSHIRPIKMDLYAYVLDGYLGQPAFVLGRIVEPHPWAKILLNVAYGLLPIGVTVTLAAEIWRWSSNLRLAVWAFVINLTAAPLFYVLVPVCGPKFAFPSFPLDPGRVLAHGIPIDAAPNGVPSVHTSTVLLIVWFCRRSRVGLVAASVYLLLILASTLASGQHYAVDLLAAIPYAAGAVWVSRLRWFRGAAASPAVDDQVIERNMLSGLHQPG